MTIGLMRFLYRETTGTKARVVTGSVVSGLSRGALLATFNGGAAAAAAGHVVSGYLIAGFLAALGVYLLATFDSLRASTQAVELMTQRLRLRLCAKLLFTQLRLVETRGTGDVYTQLSHDLNRLSGAAIAFLAGFQSLVLLAFALAYLAWLSPLGFAATAATILIGTITYWLQDRAARRNVEKARFLQSRFFDGIHDLLHGFKELKLSRARHGGLMAHLDDVSERYRDLTVKTETLFLVGFLTSQLFIFLLIGVLVFGLPVLLPAKGQEIFQFLATILFLVGPVETLARTIPVASKARVSLESVEELEEMLDEGIAAEENKADRVAALNFREIAFRDVHFRFSAVQAADSFDVGPIDLTIRRGEMLFVVGGNGAGKTTFLKLLTGLYTPDSGSVLVDGREIGIADRQRYREMFAAVFSDFHVFRRLYGVSPSAAEAEALLTELGLAHKTRIENGELSAIHLSAGQRKRLAYAVNRFFDRQIYVFDEFAADQDPAFRRYFYAELLPKLRAQGKTVVAVTHDERYFDVADRVVKMDYGRVADIVVHEHEAAIVH